MSSICNRSGIKLKPFSLFPHDILHEQPWRAALVASVGLPARGFSSHLVALVTRLFSVLDFRKAWLAFFFFSRRRGVLRIFPGEYHLLFLFFDMIYAVTLSPHETTSSSTI